MYTGDKEYKPKPDETDQETQEPLYSYVANEEIIQAVNLAIQLNRPLLLEGEPGCGKTRLARAVAYEFGKKYQQDEQKWPYADWYIKSSDQARDGLYIYDAIWRLYDVQMTSQLSTSNVLDTSEIEKIRKRLSDIKHEAYITWGAIGKAFRASQKGQRMIVLIDEIDKADPDLPNDLLLELEEKRFFVKETGEEVKIDPKYQPIIFITSNGQRKLSDAFLRRCIYCYIGFPSTEKLEEIVTARFGDRKKWTTAIITQSVIRFCNIRQKMEENKGEFGKKVSTSEFLDWLNALELNTQKAKDLKSLLEQDNIPYPNTLFKSRDDLEFAEGLNNESI
ncbi:ATPase [Nostoc sphaeroides CCNUC1]|uniref:ATPase n=2 Tax=Nostoc sphaeroides TaxID=446679 RepID=A0A5P8WIJ8_9NOSO|nr:ATPase [Nostoc sphaeroides CCNUC1]